MDGEPLRDLRALIALLERERELVTVEAEVSSHLEMAEIHRRVIAAGGPALLFTNVKGSPYRAVTNLFGTRRRVDLAFGDRAGRALRDLVALAKDLPPTLSTLWKRRDLLSSLARVGVRERKAGEIQEVAEEPRLGSLPLLQLWPDDGGHFVTLPLVYTEHPDGHESNLGMYRMQRYDDRTTGMHWQIGKGGGFHYAVAEERGVALPVTVTLGGPPALILSAIAPLPEGVPELMLASLVLGEKLPRVRDPRAVHPLIAGAEVVMSGHVPPRERRAEGPFGDHYGYYSLQHDYPVFHCERVFRRRDAIVPSTVVGKPRQEDFFLGDYLQELLSPLFPLVMPAVRSLWSYGETGFHSLSAAVVKERYPREALASAFRILGEGQLSLTKFLLVTDTPRDLRDFRGTLAHVLARARFDRDLRVFGMTAMDTLDYAGPRPNEGSKGVLLGIGDAIRELPRAWSGPPPEGFGDARAYCDGCLVVSGPTFGAERDAAKRLARDPRIAGWPLVALVDDAAKATASDAAFLWTVFTRFEPAADLHARETRLAGHHVAYEPPLVLDARMKPWYPATVESAPDTDALVTRRWAEYFPRGGVAMGDSHRADVD